MTDPVRTGPMLAGTAHDALGHALSRLATGKHVDLRISVSNGSISIDDYAPEKPPVSDSDQDSSPVAAAAVARAVKEAIDDGAATIPSSLVRALMFTNLAEEGANNQLYLGSHAAELVAKLAAEHAPQAPSKWAFELGSHVVLETSRADFEALRLEEKQDREIAQGRLSGAPEPVRLWRCIGPIEQGEVIGRSEYDTGHRSYLVRYRNGAGCQVQEWHEETALFQPEPEFEEVAGEKATG